MIRNARLFGMSLATRSQRRRLVVLYYACLVGLAMLFFWHPHAFFGALCGQCVLIGGLLGGVRADGPVRPYTKAAIAGDADAAGVITLDLDGLQARQHGRRDLDEREVTSRDHAHFVAYRMFLLSLGLVAVLVALFWNWTGSWLGARMPALFWLLLVYALSLPQSLLLWTEPVGAEDELTLVNPLIP